MIRPARLTDVSLLVDLAERAGVGLTTLPADARQIEQRLAMAELSFRGECRPDEADYLFVLEDDSGALIGITAIKGAVGLREPSYTYRVGTMMNASPDVDVRRPLQVLWLSHELGGTSEICSLFLHPAHRLGWNGKLLSLSRFLFMAEHPQLFTNHVIAEMRGVSDAAGESPFWNALGAHFFDMPFAKADYLSAGRKTFIAELMPRYPIYCCLLPKTATDVIGQVHEHTKPALRLLQKEGFSACEHVDIFDAGPVLKARRADIRCVADSRLFELSLFTTGVGGEPYLIYNRLQEECRIQCLLAEVADGVLRVDPQAAERCGFTHGQVVRAVPLHAQPGVSN